MDAMIAGQEVRETLEKLKAAMTAHAAVLPGDADKFGETWLAVWEAHRNYCVAFEIWKERSAPK